MVIIDPACREACVLSPHVYPNHSKITQLKLLMAKLSSSIEYVREIGLRTLAGPELLNVMGLCKAINIVPLISSQFPVI